MDIGGLQKCSLIDYPGEISATLFTQGCNFRCPYCHNRELVIPEEYGPLIPESEVVSFLERRAGKLDAVVITGGEPCLQPDLLDFMRRVKDMGFLIKLDTNGSMSARLKSAAGIADYIAMDIKAPPGRYASVAGAGADTAQIKESIRAVMDSGRRYEFRTTVPAGVFGPEDFREIGPLVEGAELYYLQNYVPPAGTGHQEFKSCPADEIEAFRKVLERFVKKCGVR